MNCRTVLQTDVLPLPFRIGKQGEEFARGGHTCVLSVLTALIWKIGMELSIGDSQGPASFNVTISVFAWSDSGLSFIPLFSLLFHVFILI